MENAGRECAPIKLLHHHIVAKCSDPNLARNENKNNLNLSLADCVLLHYSDASGALKPKILSAASLCCQESLYISEAKKGYCFPFAIKYRINAGIFGSFFCVVLSMKVRLLICTFGLC